MKRPGRDKRFSDLKLAIFDHFRPGLGDFSDFASKHREFASKQGDVASKHGHVASKQSDVAPRHGGFASKQTDDASKHCDGALEHSDCASKQDSGVSKQDSIAGEPGGGRANCREGIQRLAEPIGHFQG